MTPESHRFAGFRGATLARGALEAAILAAFLAGALTLGWGRLSPEALAFRPVPDTVEQVWVAAAFAQGRSPLLPVGNELHPSRFSPVHPAALSLWLRLHGGAPEAAAGWPPVAAALGLAALYAWMLLAGVPLLWRLTAFFLLFFSPGAFETSRELMQESSFTLLFGLSAAAWALGWRAFERAADEGAYSGIRAIGTLALFALAGALAGALAFARPTLAPWPGLMFLATLWSLRRPGARRFPAQAPAAALAAGALAVAALTLIYIHRVAGVWGLVAYHHWKPHYGQDSMALAQPFTKPPNTNINEPNSTDLYYDGHIVQFVWYQALGARGWVDPAARAAWPSPPDQSHLYHPFERRVNIEFLQGLLERYGQVALYYPADRAGALAPLLESPAVAQWTAESVSGAGGWTLQRLKTPER